MPVLLESYGSNSIKPEFRKAYSLLVQNKAKESVAAITSAKINTCIGRSTWEGMTLLGLAIYAGKISSIKQILTVDGIDLELRFSALGMAIAYYNRQDSEKEVYQQIILEILKKNPSFLHQSVIICLASAPKNDPVIELILELAAYQCDANDSVKKGRLAGEIGAKYKKLMDFEESQKWSKISFELGDPLGGFNYSIGLNKQKKYAEQIAVLEKTYLMWNVEKLENRQDVVNQLLDLLKFKHHQFDDMQECFNVVRLVEDALQRLSPNSLTEEIKKFLFLEILPDTNKDDKANLIDGISLLSGFQGLTKNIIKAIPVLKKVKHSELLPYANLHLYFSYSHLFLQSKNIHDEEELFQYILALCPSIRSSYTSYTYWDKETLLQLLISVMDKAQDEKDKIQLFNFMLQLISPERKVEQTILDKLDSIDHEKYPKFSASVKQFILECLIASGDQASLKKLLGLYINSHRKNECATIYRRLGDVYAQQQTETGNANAFRSYQAAVLHGDISSAIPAAGLARDLDQAIDLYQEALTFYSNINDTEKLKVIICQLESMKETLHLSSQQKNKLADIERVTQSYSAILAGKKRQDEVDAQVQFLEELSQQEKVDDVAKAKLLILEESGVLAIADTSKVLKKYISQKEKTEQQQKLIVEDKKLQVKSRRSYRIRSWGYQYALVNDDYLPAVAELMHYYLNRSSIFQGSVRRKLYLCTKVLLLSTNMEMVKKRFSGMTEESLQAFIKEATDYLTFKAAEVGFKYLDFAKWCLAIVDEQKNQNKILLNPDAFLLKPAIPENFKSHIKHAMHELNMSSFATPLLASNFLGLVAGKIKEEVNVLYIEEPLEDVVGIIKKLKTSVMQKAKPVIESAPQAAKIWVSASCIPASVKQAQIGPSAPSFLGDDTSVDFSNAYVVRMDEPSAACSSIIEDEGLMSSLYLQLGRPQASEVLPKASLSSASVKTEPSDILNLDSLDSMKVKDFFTSPVSAAAMAPTYEYTTPPGGIVLDDASSQVVAALNIARPSSDVKEVHGILIAKCHFGEALPYSSSRLFKPIEQPLIAPEDKKDKVKKKGLAVVLAL